MRELFRRVVPYSWRLSFVTAAATRQKRHDLRNARRAYRALAAGTTHPMARRFGEETDGQPVVMCLWRRPERFADSLRALAAQDVPGGIRLILWNNDPSQDAHYWRLAASGVRGAVRSIDVYSSAINIGGAARMVVGRLLRADRYAGPVVLIDDDQDIDGTFVRDLTAAWRPRTFGGTWAWRIHGDYWDRSRARAGERATYVGTGGSVVDSDLLADDLLAARLDSADLMCEDILLSARGHELDYRVIAIDATFTFAEDEHDQWHALASAKSDLYRREGRFALFPRTATPRDPEPTDSTSHRAE